MTYVNTSSVTGVGILFIILSVGFLAARFEARRRWKNPLGVDDLLIVPAVVLVVGSGIVMAIGAQKDLIGGHSPTQGAEAFLASQLERQILLEKYEFGLLLTHVVATSLIKLSILFFYRRVFRGHTRRTAFDVVNWTLIGIQTAWLITAFLTTLFACGRHVDALWGSLADLKKYCFNTFWQNAVLAILNFIMDLAVLTLPLAVIWTLNMTRVRKFQASAVFLVAMFAVAAGCVRMVAWIKINLTPFGSGQPLLGLPNSNDDIAVVSILLFWNFIEIGVGSVVACMPSQRRYIDIGSKRFVYFWQNTSLRSLLSGSRRTRSATKVPREEGGPSRQRSDDEQAANWIELGTKTNVGVAATAKGAPAAPASHV